jgi:hypothetical protein
MALLPFALGNIVAISYVKERLWYRVWLLISWPFEEDGITSGHYMFLVTNKHVFERENRIALRFNSEGDAELKNYYFPIIDKERDPSAVGWPPSQWYWCCCARSTLCEAVRRSGPTLAFLWQSLITIDQMREAKVSEGDLSTFLVILWDLWTKNGAIQWLDLGP